MDTTTAPRAAASPSDRRRHAMLQGLFAAAIGGSALLMFLVEPMVGKALLPALGGTPQVWNTCMVFFQAMLFAGYLHAHCTGLLIGARRQLVVHLLLVAAALLLMPYGVSAARLASPDAHQPVPWLMQVLVLSIGAPVFVIAATAPLLQKWFAGTGHPHAHDPYFLYAASNAGSLLALLAYPTIVEPASTLGQQWAAWSLGFGLLALLLFGCAAVVGRRPGAVAVAAAVAAPAPAPQAAQRLRWLLLSFAPSSLLLGVTTTITTDVAAVPLFWIVPLALYLLTFIIAFSRRPALSTGTALRGQALALTLLAVVSLVPGVASSMAAGIALLHLACFFLTALACHGELVRARPAAAHLTEFYLWMSLGGLLGGAFNALLAPVVFSQLLEYPLVLVLACLLRPAAAPGGSAAQRALDVLLPALLALLGWAALRGLPRLAETVPVGWALLAMVLALAATAALLLGFSPRPLRFALGVGVLAVVAAGQGGDPARSGTLVFQERSFFGLVRVVRNEALGVRVFVHGSTVHGVQHADPAKAGEPATYYHRGGAYGRFFEAAAPVIRDRPVAVVGLGAGSLACYGRPGSDWTFFEIDPLVERVARDERLFTFLRDCPPRTKVVIGDARVTLRDAPDRGHAVIVIDAFTSDAIPTHLLTREALALYRRKLAPDGLLVLHISNRHLTLGPTIGNLARDAGLVGRISKVVPTGQNTLIASPAQLVVLAPDATLLGPLADDPAWLPLPADAGQRVWTDDHVDIMRALFGG